MIYNICLNNDAMILILFYFNFYSRLNCFVFFLKNYIYDIYIYIDIVMNISFGGVLISVI